MYKFIGAALFALLLTGCANMPTGSNVTVAKLDEAQSAQCEQLGPVIIRVHRRADHESVLRIMAEDKYPNANTVAITRLEPSSRGIGGKKAMRSIRAVAFQCEA
ncbi:hypothetical protein J4N45_26280 [Vibrio sp. SCSIO 43140]|uniref:hypothetical protein n=1 Tax=Vibrio sp. SCSIO 43140 TaxID=2819100 RepID=UPI002074DAA2|nr:hypothetical protein [Vibrio sp. SCSIO 43140]USD62865.1 hypothetical protein J4N45_26280 [Vibrio sp. SCSIO 43140]